MTNSTSFEGGDAVKPTADRSSGRIPRAAPLWPDAHSPAPAACSASRCSATAPVPIPTTAAIVLGRSSETPVAGDEHVDLVTVLRCSGRDEEGQRGAGRVLDSAREVHQQAAVVSHCVRL